jgi:transposase-like protein
MKPYIESLNGLLCPNCSVEGKDNFVKMGFKQLYQKRAQRYQCKRCGRVFHE